MNESIPRIFISHSSQDNDFGSKLAQDLRHVLGDDTAVWYDISGGLQVGDAWWRTIVKELTARPVFIVILSPYAVASPWVNDEIDLAWRQKNSPARLRIIPVLYRPCQARYELYNLQMVSFLPPKPYQEAFNELLMALGLPPSNRTRSTARERTDFAGTQFVDLGASQVMEPPVHAQQQRPSQIMEPPMYTQPQRVSSGSSGLSGCLWAIVAVRATIRLHPGRRIEEPKLLRHTIRKIDLVLWLRTRASGTHAQIRAVACVPGRCCR